MIMNIQNNILPLKPSSDYVLEKPFVFFVGAKTYNKSLNTTERFVEEIKGLEFLCVSRYREESETYQMTTRNFTFTVKVADEHDNFQVTSISDKREAQAKKKSHYNQSSFIIHLQKGTTIVCDFGYDKSITNRFGIEERVMLHSDLVSVVNAIKEFFNYKEENTESFVSGRFKSQILDPIDAFTEYEDAVEKRSVYSKNYIEYDRCVFNGSYKGDKEYSFESSTFDPDNEDFAVDSNVAVELKEQTADGTYKTMSATIVDRQITENGVEFVLKFRLQFDDDIIPKDGGIIYPQVNETQKRVRKRVLKSIRDKNVASKYMYNFFRTYQSEGFDEVDDWKQFENELLKGKRPPNAGQMDAIRKGIATKDLHLVLGPPGTGKTTVIVNWIKYFVEHDMRVLISSQNNAAVDNVLERAGDNKNAHIIRLGDERKILDPCKKYAINAQIDDGVKLYREKIDQANSRFKESRTKINQAIALYRSNIDRVIVLSHESNKLNSKINAINSKFNELKKAKAEMENAYSKYEGALDEIAVKNIALFELENRGSLYRFFHRHHKRLIEKERDELIEQHKVQSEKYLSYVDSYNEIATKIRSIYNDSSYHDLKTSVLKSVSELASINWDLNIDVPRKSIRIQMDRINGYPIPNANSLTKAISELEQSLKTIDSIEASFSDWSSALDRQTSDIVTDLLIRNSNVVGATCIGINTRRKFANIDFDVSIIDESGQIQVHNAIVPMSRAPKTLMLGDHLQIPPMASDDVMELCRLNGCSTELLEKSFFEYLFKTVEETAEARNKEPECITRLVEQFRMPANISDVISSEFYDDKYFARYNMDNWTPIVPNTTKPLIMISTSGLKQRYETTKLTPNDPSAGYCNKCEAEIIAKIVASIQKEKGELDSSEIGIISAYGKQVRAIRQYITKEKLGLSNQQIYSIAASLDSFQGQERDLIIFSSTRSSNKDAQHARIGFLKELRRLNVAFTRCKKQLVVIGDFDYLTTCEYEVLDEFGKPVKHKSEKDFAMFMQKMIDQAKSPAGEFYTAEEFLRKVGAEIWQEQRL